ncbi:MAG: hypothetical protein JXR41_04395 [Bacteroidales bacterium]|nr:hypothetical protein [Bacteroidales bacterium]
MLKKKLPVEIIFTPEWWNKHTGITFDRDYFFHPLKRIESEQNMEKALYERWGKYGLGANKDEKRPEVGPVHLAAGFMLSEMMGCKVRYSENHPPQVIPEKRDSLLFNMNDVFKSNTFKEFCRLKEQLKQKYGYLTGDVNWGGILNLAIDLRGEDIFTDIMLDPDAVREYFLNIAGLIDKFTDFVQTETGSSSIAVNRAVRHFDKPVFLHSQCSHTMISTEDYENVLLEYDIRWSKIKRPFGIHYCGRDPHRFAETFAKIPHLDFLDVGWGGDVKMLRKYLPGTFLNIRLSPVELITQSNNEIREIITRLVHESGDPCMTGICCINLDDKIQDSKITTILKTVDELRQKL